MKIVLAGSPSISVAAFQEVIKNFDVVAIVTQPDKPSGRGMHLHQTPVSELAQKHGIKLFKPKKISEIYDELRNLNFDLFLSFAFGQYVPEKILKLGKYKPLNIHGSLLPKYRGAAPIHYAILNGDNEIGITLIEMIKEMDAGNVYFKASHKINNETTTGEAFEIVSRLAKENIVTWLKEIKSRNIKPIPQGNGVTYSPKIEKSFGKLTHDLSVNELKRKVRGLNPFPCSFTIFEGKRLKVFNVSDKFIMNSIEFKCNDGVVYIFDYQFEGKKRKTLIC